MVRGKKNPAAQCGSAETWVVPGQAPGEREPTLAILPGKRDGQKMAGYIQGWAYALP